MRMANCWIAAMWIWLASRMRYYAWIRRSHSFRGAIPHFGVALPAGWRRGAVVEYIPPKRVLWSTRNWLILFRGEYRVWEFRLFRVRRFKTRAAALQAIYDGD